MRPLTKTIIFQRVTVISALLFVSNVYSQDFKLARVQYANYPKSVIKNGSGNQETSFQEFGAFVNLPKMFNNDSTALINGVGYGFVEATMHNFPSLPSSEYNKKLQLFYYQVTLIHKWNKKWTLLASLKPTIASDFVEKLSSNDLVFQGTIMVVKNMNDKLKLGVGVLNSTRWGPPIVLPTVSLNYKYKKHQFNAHLPISLKYTYSLLPKEKLKIGVKYARNGANFNISNAKMPEIDKLNYSRANIGLFASYQLTRMLRLEARGGVSTGRIYRLVDDDRNVLDFDSKAAPFFNIGISLIPPKIK
jgi:hypothetical protein